MLLVRMIQRAAVDSGLNPFDLPRNEDAGVSEDQAIGCIVGLAVGDALGYPAEFRTRRQLLDEVGPDGITDFMAIKDGCFSKPFLAGDGHPLDGMEP